MCALRRVKAFWIDTHVHGLFPVFAITRNSVKKQLRVYVMSRGGVVRTDSYL